MTVEAALKNGGETPWAPPPEAAVQPVVAESDPVGGGGNFLADGAEMAELPSSLGPREEFGLQLAVTTPAEPGDYVLEFDIFQWGVGWFKNLGVGTTKVPARIAGAGGPPEGAPLVGDPGGASSGIEMHVLPKNEVLQLITGAGGRVVEVRDVLDEQWISPYYVAIKR
jgi:hypothetical protein